MRRVVSASLSPNSEADDVWLALRLLFMPWSWKSGSGTAKVELWFRQYLDSSTAVSFNSGRSAELAILRAFGIGRGDEVIVQAFTCVAVPNSVMWAGATPVFADIGESYTMDPKDFERKITKKTKAVIVQHTFGISANVKDIIAISKKHNIRVIEDFAHTMSLPMQGDAAFFSFGRDKVVSSVFGGLAAIDAHWKEEGAKLKAYHKTLPTPSMLWIFQQLFHPVAFSLVIPLYTLGLGKVLLVMFQRLGLLSFPVYREEKSGLKPDIFPAKYPNGLAFLLLNQLRKLDRYTKHRKEIVTLYGSGGSLIRYPMRVDNPKKSMERAKRQGILLGNWYHNVIDPTGVEFSAVGYIQGSCPRAEDAAAHVINLPTRISKKDAKRVMDTI